MYAFFLIRAVRPPGGAITPPHTPRKPKTSKTSRREGDTIKKTELFKAVDSRGLKPLRLVYQKEKIKPSTAELWLRQRRQIVLEVAYRRTGAFRMGRPLKIPDEKLTEILDSKNNARDEGYER
ncbi:hypothetical protein HO133_002197 [Letharia lupina]|uniref:Uncharacterized protein n=1 Tax=Letharia lupina TaxID=560253 RepID=A0A8H6CD74_9LECA|nr:uncharacterized protein HO133_002197 [Letharia lupina]KAF6221342.1 hypothetical protein HO133_002197 [Letharia lupina]